MERSDTHHQGNEHGMMGIAASRPSYINEASPVAKDIGSASVLIALVNVVVVWGCVLVGGW
jgi:hypothetical protein